MFQANLITPEEAVMPTRPDSAAAQHILEAIRQAGGAITYEQFVQCSMYGRTTPKPGETPTDYGFYSSGQAEVGGGEGQQDFQTHTVNPAFGRSIAHYAYETWQLLGASPRLAFVEMGAGNGAQARSFLHEIRRQAALANTEDDHSFAVFQKALQYYILEYGAGMIEKQCKELAGRGVLWVHGSAIDLPIAPTPHDGEEPIPFLLACNELPDTFPSALVVKEGAGFKAELKEVYVSATDQGAFYETLGSLSSKALARQAYQAESRLPMEPGSVRVFNLRAQRWARNMGRLFKWRKGGILIIDYGNPSDIMDMPPRIYHRSINTPYASDEHEQTMHRLQYELPGEVDITTSVAFGAIDAILQRSGLKRRHAHSEAVFLDSYGFQAHAGQNTSTRGRRTQDQKQAPRAFMAYSYISNSPGRVAA